MLGVAEGTQNSHQTKLDADPLTLQRQIDGFQQMTIEGGSRAGRVFKYAWYKERWVDGQMTENKGAAANFIFADLKAGIIGAAISQSDNPDPCSSADFDSAGAIDCSNEFFECVDDQWLIDIVHTDLADGGFPSRFTYGTAKLPAPPAVQFRDEYYASFPLHWPDGLPTSSVFHTPAGFVSAVGVIGSNPALWPLRKL